MLNIRQKFMTRLSSVLMVLVLGLLMTSMSLGESIRGNQTPLSMLEAGVTMDGPGFFGGSAVRIDGNVDGTTFAFGQNITVNGDINGDLIIAGQTLTINGKVNGNIYGAGQSLTIRGQGMRDVFLGAQDINLAKESVIGRDLFFGGQTLIFEGAVARDLRGGGMDIDLNGQVGRNAELEAESIRLTDNAVINGDLLYTSAKEAFIAPGAQITGRTDWTYREPEAPPQMRPHRLTMASTYWGMLINMAGTFIIWLVVKLWQPEYWAKASGHISETPLKTLGVGALVLIVVPILTVLVMLTVIGIPLGVITGLIYGVSLYLSKIVVAVFIGAWLSKRLGWPEIHKGMWLFLLGLLILMALMQIPYLGLLIRLLVVFAGIGALALSWLPKPAAKQLLVE
jgi:cytoskeletal protein CcmA (bactofilin family)